jgi:hypothetical protein
MPNGLLLVDSPKKNRSYLRFSPSLFNYVSHVELLYQNWQFDGVADIIIFKSCSRKLEDAVQLHG